MKKSFPFLLEPRYDFLRTHKDIAGQIILLMLGGAHAYGIATEDSDIDLRGITIEKPEEIFGIKEIETFVEQETDTVLYRLRKTVKLLLQNNPNILEILGCDDQHIVEISPEGKMLRDNLPLFLNKRVIKAFGGYANDQLRRAKNGLLQNKAEAEKKKDVFNTLNKFMYHLQEKYNLPSTKSIQLYLMEQEICMDICLTGYPLQNFVNVYSEMNNVMREYNKLNHRNNKKTERGIYKHLSHLVRVFVTGIEILEGGKVQILREKEHDLLLGIKQGKYSLDEIFMLVDDLERRFREAKNHHCLPDEPNYKKINELLVNIYKVRGI